MAANKSSADTDKTDVPVGEGGGDVHTGVAAPSKPPLEVHPTPVRKLLSVQPPPAGSPQDASRMIQPAVYQKHQSTPITGHDSVDLSAMMNSSEDSSLERTAR